MTTQEMVRTLSASGHQISAKQNRGGTLFICRRCSTTASRKTFAAVAAMGACAANILRGNMTQCGADATPQHAGEESASSSNGLKRSGNEILAASPAAKRGTNPERAASEPQTLPPMVGHTRLHASHHVAFERGIFYCQRCGFYAISDPKKLTLPCARTTTKGSQLYLERIAKGKTPRSNMAWPNPTATLSGVVWVAT